ncbi:MAG: hypothetical protein BWX80_01261 [Candidatus Hydrogenedentes bacterium ADurb.Bin101]|nr:MAG: hypothetical protein BWX80_01261 [Candidatus Hydrogenedentes bacterium ADurb.Bin101]
MVMGGDETAFAHDTELVFPDKMVHGEEAQFISGQQQVLEIVPSGKDEQGAGVLQQAVGPTHPLQSKGAVVGDADFRVPVQHTPRRAVIVAALRFEVDGKRRVGNNKVNAGFRQGAHAFDAVQIVDTVQCVFKLHVVVLHRSAFRMVIIYARKGGTAIHEPCGSPVNDEILLK